MKWIKSIRIRFALWATILIIAILAIFGAFVYINLSINLRAAIDDSLALGAAQTAANLNVNNGQIFIGEAISSQETEGDVFTQRGLTLIILSKTNQILESVGPYSTAQVPVAAQTSVSTYLTLPKTGEEDSIRVYILPVMDNDQIVGWVETLQSLSSVEDSLQRLLTALLVGGGALSLLAGFAGYFLAARALSPVDKITQKAKQISTQDLSARLNLPDTGDEVSRLASTFDEMLTRIEKGFQRERQFTADASHELRTPLAAMQVILSVTRQRRRQPSDYELALDDLDEEANRLRDLIESLLALARGDEHTIELNEIVDLSTLLEDVSDSLRPISEDKGLDLRSNIEPMLTIQGNSDSLIRLFVNLLDNAIKYTENGSVAVKALRKQDLIVISIVDTGIGIAEEHMPHIFERFYQVDKSRSNRGTGLGLSLVQQIVLAHRGRIEAISKPLHGSTFIVTFPYSQELGT